MLAETRKPILKISVPYYKQMTPTGVIFFYWLIFLFGFIVYLVFSYVRQVKISLFFFFQGLFQQFSGIIISHGSSQHGKCAIRSNFIMLHFLSCCNYTHISG